MTSLFGAALTRRPVVLDGGLATRLEERGHDLSGDLWSARLLLEQPEAIVAAHRDFFAAGADVATTASYQVSYEAMAAMGLGRAETERLLALSVRLARQAADGFLGDRWVAASVGPYGAMLADGAEYRGGYGRSVDQLRAWHRPRLAALMAAEPDVLALETIPCLAEVEAVLAEVAGTGMACWLSLTSDGLATREGDSLGEAFAMARDVSEVVAVGVNCCSTQRLDEVVALATRAADKPAVVYPNSGEQWDGETRVWTGTGAFDPGAVTSWVAAGARLVGGCCRVGPTDIARVADELASA